MPKLIANTTVLDGFVAKVLLAGEELPGWAVGLVGEHLLDESPAPEPENVEDDDEQDGEPAAASSGEPDFTKPAQKRGRPRKQR